MRDKPLHPRDPGIREPTMNIWVAIIGCSLPMIVCLLGLAILIF